MDGLSQLGNPKSGGGHLVTAAVPFPSACHRSPAPTASRATADTLRNSASDNGMRSLAEDARAKVAARVTAASEAAPLLALLQ